MKPAASPTASRFTSLTIRGLIGLAALLLCCYAQWRAPTTSSFVADEWLRDRIARMQVSNAPDDRILVVDIDEASMKAKGPWPWKREQLADLLETLLTTYSARGVALDIVLSKAADASGDARLALLAEHGPVVLGQAFDFSQTRPELLREGLLGGAGDYPASNVRATGYLGNHADLVRPTTRVGNIGFILDPDGALRRVPLVTMFGGKAYPALGLALVNCCSGGQRLSLPEPGQMRVPYLRDWSAYTVVSAADILDEGIDINSAKDKLVLIGSSSLGLGDRVTTPLNENRPGLGVQATILSALLDRQAGATPKPWPGRLLACLFTALVAAASVFAFPRLSAAACVALLGASAALWLGAAYILCPHDDALVTTGPLASCLLLLAVAIPYQWQLSQRRSRRLLDTLRQYVAPEVVDELLRSDVEDPLKPRQLDVTTLIADMEGYTTQVESLPVAEAATLTRDFLDCLTGPVIEKHGTLDKYTGDGLVAFWGAPLPVEQHADLALDAALAIVARVAQLSATRMAEGKQALRVRIGIESGLAMAGDFGTSFRSIYTAVGDSVNTASRLEQAARDFSHCVIIGAGTVERARRHRFLLLGERLLRGKEKPTTLFTFETSMEQTNAALQSTPTSTAAAPMLRESAA